MEHRLPGGHRGAGQRCALVDRKMRGNFDDAFLFQHHIFGQHAIDAAAERRSVHMRARLAARPALEETAGDFVAGFDAGDAGPGFNHFAGAVRQWDEIFAHRRPIGAAYDAEVAIVERTGNDLDQHLSVKRLRRRPLDKGQRLDAGAAFGQLIGTHSWISGICISTAAIAGRCSGGGGAAGRCSGGGGAGNGPRYHSIGPWAVRLAVEIRVADQIAQAIPPSRGHCRKIFGTRTVLAGKRYPRNRRTR